MCLHPRGGEKSLLKTENKIQELQGDLSLITLNSEKQNFSLILDTFERPPLRDLYKGFI